LHTLGVQNRRSINTATKMKSLHSKDGTTCDHTEQQLKAALHVVGRRSHPAAPNCAHSSTLSTTSNGALDCLQNTQTSCAAATHSSSSNAVHRALQQSLQSTNPAAASSSKTAQTGRSCVTFQ
jgi:hypothetical protein